MKALFRASRAGDRGAAAVEFAILVPLLLLFVAGILGFGLYLWGTQSANFGAREGARLAAVGVNDCTAWKASTTARSGVAAPTSLTLTYQTAGTTTTTASPVVGDTVVVTLTYKNNGPANGLLAAATALFPGGALQLPSTATTTGISRAEVIGAKTSC